MARDTTQVEVLQRILDRLRATLALNDRQCYLSLSRWLPPRQGTVGGDFWVVVSPGPGRFEESYQIGGGTLQVTEQTEVVVAACTRIRLDQAEHAEILFTDTTRGLYRLKERILNALASHELAGTDGQPLLVQYLTPTSTGPPEYDPQSGIACVTVTFACDFNWNLA